MFKEQKHFFSHFLKHAKQTASIIPTSKYATKKVCNEIDFSHPVVVVELGPGMGNVAEEVAKRMSPTSRLILIEINPEFVAFLRERFAGDERVEVCEDLAQHVGSITSQHHIEGVDAVLANIPFTFFDNETRNALVSAVKEVLKPGGVFIAFPFTTTIRPYLKKAFSQVTEKNIWLNIPPLQVFVAKKEG